MSSGLSADRRAAVALLLRQQRQRGRLDRWLVDKSSSLSPREARRLRALVYGINRQRSLLEHRLEPFLKRPFEGQDPEVKAVLLLGTYELLHQDGVPSRAAVQQAVEGIRFLGMERRTGFVNAVLRRVAAVDEPPVLPDRGTDPLGWAQLGTSHPRWILTEMARLVGEDEAVRWAEANNEEPQLALRTGSPDEPVPPGAESSETVAGGWFFPERPEGRVDALPGFAEGQWWVQDLAAQAAALLLEPRPGARVLDACAAPGGKTFVLAGQVGSEGTVCSWDASPRRLGQMQESLARLGLAGGVVAEQRNLLERPWEEPAAFDGVIVDAPCSGLGVMRRHPDVRWQRQREEITVLAARQKSLLAAVAPAVRPGGILVYAVCTFTEAETDGVLSAFLEAQPEFSLAPPSAECGIGQPLLNGATLRTLPHRDGMDAFYAVRLRRSEGAVC